MTTSRTQAVLKDALLRDGAMDRDLYEYDLEELLDDYADSMLEDDNDILFAVTETHGRVAMLLIERSGATHVNEAARQRLKSLWPAAYEQNIRGMIPEFARQLDDGQIPYVGVTVVN